MTLKLQVSPFNRFEVSGRIYYDQNEERIAIKEEVISGDEKDYYQDFAFYKQVSLQIPLPPHIHTPVHVIGRLRVSGL